MRCEALRARATSPKRVAGAYRSEHRSQARRCNLIVAIGRKDRQAASRPMIAPVDNSLVMRSPKEKLNFAVDFIPIHHELWR
jgi:hypothetical protein